MRDELTEAARPMTEEVVEEIQRRAGAPAGVGGASRGYQAGEVVTAADIPALAPLAEREILYRLLKSEEGYRLRQMATAHSQGKRIAKAIEWLKAHYAEPLRIKNLASEVNMSPSSLHHHFKAVTAMSPPQYPKQLRLQEARRLLLSEAVDAATAGHRVGYESPSQFSREYRRLFGAPPARDLRRRRSSVSA